MRIKSAALLVLFALLLNALFPFFTDYHANQANASSPFGGKLLICSEEGVKWINLNKKSSDHPAKQPHYECALCYLAAHGLMHLNTVGTVTLAGLPSLSQTMALKPSDAGHFSSSPYTPQQSRAPPVV
jgi:hypothetical protein